MFTSGNINLNKTLLTFFLILIVLSIPIKAQLVTKISENGIQIEIESRLEREIRKEPANSKNIIRSWFSSLGYLNAKVDEVERNNFILKKGCLFLISDLKIDNALFSHLSKKNLGAYSKRKAEDELNELLNVLEGEGYLFAKVEITSFELFLESCEVSIGVEIDEGVNLYSENILFPGAKLNHQEYLQRVSGFKDSVLLTSYYLEELRMNLIQSELFEEVGTPNVYLDQDRPVIVIPIQEASLNQFNGLLGYVPDQRGNGQIVGDFDLSLWNVLNQGNGITLQYERLRPEVSRLSIGISQDYFGSIPVGLALNFGFYQNDTTYQTRSFSLSSYYLVSRGLKITSSISTATSVSGDDTMFNLEPDGKKRSAELGFQYSTINSKDVPTEGIQLGVSFGISNKSVDIDSVRSFSQRFISTQASFFFPITHKSVLALSAQSYFLNSGKTTESDLIRFGGANSFRGYSEEQFRASSLVWGDLEYRFLMNRYSYLFAFGALGKYYRPQLLTELDSTFKVSDLLYSTGFGISYKIRIGRLKFTYAISPTESVGNGKVHVGIITRI